VRRRGQALVELAVCLPVLLLVAFGAVQFVRLAVARAGLDAATSAAVAAAARAPTAGAAVATGRAAFDGVAAGYDLGPTAVLSLDPGDFGRGARFSATARADLFLGLGGVSGVDPAWRLTATASARVEDWRSRPAAGP
jgi:Flp pilus assembly protein TadG